MFVWLASLLSCTSSAPDQVWPLRSHRGHVVATVEVHTPKGPKNRQCLVDTGASFSVSRFGNDRISIGGTDHRLEQDAEVIEALNVAGFDPKLTCVWGQDLLAALPVARIDYRTMELRLTEQASSLTETHRLLAHEPIVLVDVAGTERAMLLDTGATTSALAPAVFDSAGIPPTQHLEVTTQHTQQRVVEAPIPIGWAGATRRRAVRQAIPALRRFESQLGRPVVGLVGADLLDDFKVLEFRWTQREVAVAL